MVNPKICIPFSLYEGINEASEEDPNLNAP
jgi:hypothetical protein